VRSERYKKLSVKEYVHSVQVQIQFIVDEVVHSVQAEVHFIAKEKAEESKSVRVRRVCAQRSVGGSLFKRELCSVPGGAWVWSLGVVKRRALPAGAQDVCGCKFATRWTPIIQFLE
jgi:hypothetical protein